MFEFFQNQQNNEELIGMAQQIESLSVNYIEESRPSGIIWDRLNSTYGDEEGENEPDDDIPTRPQNEDMPHEDVPIDRLDRLPKRLGPDDYERKDTYSDTERRIILDFADWGDELDHDLRHDEEFTGQYMRRVRSFFRRVADIVVEDNDENREKAIIVHRLISNWLESIEELDQPLSARSLFYLNDTVQQTRMLLELYQPDAGEDELTQRHMFRMGLKCLKLSDIDFLNNLFIIDSRFLRFITAPFGLLYHDYWYYKRHTLINWIKKNHITDDIRDELFDGVQFAEMAYREKYINGSMKTKLKPYKIHYNKYNCKDIYGQFHLKRNFNGFVGFRNIAHNKKEIIIGFSGTEFTSFNNWITNIAQYIGRLPLPIPISLPIPIPYAQACGIVESIWKGTRHKRGFKDARIKVYGHSLGGGMMQYAVSNCSSDKIFGFGYNSAGLSFKNFKELENADKPIFHLYNPCDVVFILPGSVQLGGSIKFDEMTPRPIKAHLLDSIKKKIDLCKKGEISIS